MIEISYTITTFLLKYFHLTKARNARRAKHSSKPLAAKPHVQQRLPWPFESCLHGASMHSLPFAWENISSQSFWIVYEIHKTIEFRKRLFDVVVCLLIVIPSILTKKKGTVNAWIWFRFLHFAIHSAKGSKAFWHYNTSYYKNGETQTGFGYCRGG